MEGKALKSLFVFLAFPFMSCNAAADDNSLDFTLLRGGEKGKKKFEKESDYFNHSESAPAVAASSGELGLRLSGDRLPARLAEYF